MHRGLLLHIPEALHRDKLLSVSLYPATHVNVAVELNVVRFWLSCTVPLIGSVRFPQSEIINKTVR